MNENYKWKGFTFLSKGVVIEKTPIAPKPNHSYTTYNIPGRVNGSLVIDNKTYDDMPLTLECHFNSDNVNINDIKPWLDGYGKLQIDGEKEYTGRIVNTIPFDKITNFRKFIVQFSLHPLAKALTATTISQTTTGTFTANTFETYPIITMTCSGNVSVGLNGTNFTLTGADGTYVLDCEAKVITKNNVNQSNIMSGDFPKVVNGSNSLTLSGTISALTISYYKTYL